VRDDGADHRAGALRVSVAYSPAAGQVEDTELSLPASATVRDAILASGVLQRYPALAADALKVGVWGQLRVMDDALRDRDRVEIYRPLQVDPKEARRQRYRKHKDGAKRPPG
jgi:putative ubiquitin-RnfH superfamily antitoxin RatB of RatAB toxin-antitoxin module